MAKDFIKLQTLLSEIINEVGDLSKVESYNFNPSWGQFEIDDLGGEPISGKMDFVNTTGYFSDNKELFELPPVMGNIEDYDQSFALGYDIEGEQTQYMTSNYKTLMRIMKTNAEFLEYQMSSLPQDQNIVIIIAAADKKISGVHGMNQKFNLYSRVISNNLPEGWRTNIVKYDDTPVLAIWRRPKKDNANKPKVAELKKGDSGIYYVTYNDSIILVDDELVKKKGEMAMDLLVNQDVTFELEIKNPDEKNPTLRYQIVDLK